MVVGSRVIPNEKTFLKKSEVRDTNLEEKHYLIHMRVGFSGL